jgi:hypothetical protein
MHPDDQFDVMLDFVTLFEERQWLLLGLSLIIWLVMVVLCLCIAPFALIGWLYRQGRIFSLKLRKQAADKLRPKNVVRSRNFEPQSDLVAAFCDYELALVSGNETTAARSALISALAHVEQELEEHRILSAEIRKLRVEDERPRRRDAILSTKLRAERRRQREQDEGTE